MEVEQLSLKGLLLIHPRVFRDDRGFFLETYQEDRYRAHGIDCRFVQDNQARSVKGTLRGLHYQSHPGQAKLVRVTVGRVLDVVVDIRPDSPTFGRWLGVELDAESQVQLFVPIGFAHGYCVVSDEAEFHYKVSSNYDAAAESTIRFDDPELGVVWPVSDPVLSKRDQQGESFAEYRKRIGR